MANQDENWSEAVEDLVDRGDIEGAISLLESTISKLKTLNNSSSSSSKLSSALTDLANLYSSKGHSSKADKLRTQAFVYKQNATHRVSETKESEAVRVVESDAASCSNAAASSDDDWEAVADRGLVEVLSPAPNEEISKLSLEDTQFKTPKRRGRGSFLYKKDGLYCDQQPNVAISVDDDDEEVNHHDLENTLENTEKQKSRCGTKHVLILADFPPSTTTIDLEKLFEKFRDRGVVIRWVNDTVALAVFRTPSIASEAHSSVHCPFRVRVLSENDILFTSISVRDLEPPVPRPKSSARTAERLIAQGMGMKLSTTGFGSSELRKQEAARRNRIVTRQSLRDEAWGADD